VSEGSMYFKHPPQPLPSREGGLEGISTGKYEEFKILK